MRLFAFFCVWILVSPAFGQNASSDIQALLSMHEIVLQAHLNNDVSAWMAIETDSTMSVNEGDISHLGWSERRNTREAYLGRTTFEQYQDLSSPVVRVSEDGTLGWVIAEVEVVGWTARADGTIEDIANVSAWIELYQKFPDGWKMIGNVSSSRSL